jgi:hypothetical protein
MGHLLRERESCTTINCEGLRYRLSLEPLLAYVQIIDAQSLDKVPCCKQTNFFLTERLRVDGEVAPLPNPGSNLQKRSPTSF